MFYISGTQIKVVDDVTTIYNVMNAVYNERRGIYNGELKEH